MKRAFSLIELLVVIVIIAILAALLFPVFSSAKRAAKKTTCLSNMHSVGEAAAVYLGDFDDAYPETRPYSAEPDQEDGAGELDQPNFVSALAPLQPYAGGPVSPDGKISSPVFNCPEDPDPTGQRCMELDPEGPFVSSYVVNGYYVFGLSQTSIANPSNSIYLAERRSTIVNNFEPFCDDVYHPWFNSINSSAPDNDMDAVIGAIATTRHFNLSNFAFSDGHSKALPFAATYNPPFQNLHLIR